MCDLMLVAVIRPMLVLLVLLAGCGGRMGVEQGWRELQNNGTPYAPQPEYGRWWLDVLGDCNCVPVVELSTIAWVRVHARSFDCISTVDCRGSYIPSLAQAFIAAGDTLHEAVIKHEMRHAILGGDSGHRHPSWRFDVAMGLRSRGIL